MASREAVMVRRQSLLFAILGGLGLYALVRWGFGNELRPKTPHSLVFGNIKHWPGWIKNGYRPADAIAGAIGLFVALYVALMGLVVGRDATGFKAFVSLVVGIGVFGGGLTGCLGAFMGGWYFGFEFFVAGAAAFASLALVLMTLVGVLLLVGEGNVAILAASKNTRSHFGVFCTRVVVPAASWVKCSWIVRPFVTFGRYMAAKDIEEPKA